MRVIARPVHFTTWEFIDLVNPPNLHPTPDDMACPFRSFEAPAFCRLLNTWHGRPRRVRFDTLRATGTGSRPRCISSPNIVNRLRYWEN